MKDTKKNARGKKSGQPATPSNEPQTPTTPITPHANAGQQAQASSQGQAQSESQDMSQQNAGANQSGQGPESTAGAGPGGFGSIDHSENNAFSIGDFGAPGGDMDLAMMNDFDFDSFLNEPTDASAGGGMGGFTGFNLEAET